MIRTRKEAITAALNTHHNVVNTCQLVTRGWFNAPSSGDFDGDGAADAEDGWKSEPASARHPGDRNPPAGVPVSYGGGSHDNGHRALSLGKGKIRSTDAGGNGVVATVSLDFPEKEWGLKYLGWSETIDGQKIPADVVEKPKPKPKPKPKVTRGTIVDDAIALLKKARANKGSVREKHLLAAKRELEAIPLLKKK